MIPAALDQPDVRAFADHIEATAIALLVALLVWRLAVAGVDRFFARRFLGRFIPRVATFSSLAKSIAGLLVFFAFALVFLNIWAVDVTPAVWSAGIVTASLAFGAQWFIKDVIAGFSSLLEDQFDVGDYVEILTTTNAVVSGTVESIGLRSTRLVDDRGRFITVPNGNMQVSTNASRLPNRTQFTLALPWRADATVMRERVEAVSKEAAADVGIPIDRISVALVEATVERATFRIEVSAPLSQIGGARIAVIEPIVARLQADGWMPNGVPEIRPANKETS